ncbi:hypothetical protein FISHEDRAFT_58364 [Fistulina hepatica ATCC 64428]|nr:hypothetical protein FISHEDRAFT_58364 [Fistulina hepatica ATCC 64428]
MRTKVVSSKRTMITERRSRSSSANAPKRVQYGPLKVSRRDPNAGYSARTARHCVDESHKVWATHAAQASPLSRVGKKSDQCRGPAAISRPYHPVSLKLAMHFASCDSRVYPPSVSSPTSVLLSTVRRTIALDPSPAGRKPAIMDVILDMRPDASHMDLWESDEERGYKSVANSVCSSVRQGGLTKTSRRRHLTQEHDISPYTLNSRMIRRGNGEMTLGIGGFPDSNERSTWSSPGSSHGDTDSQAPILGSSD